MKSFDIPEYYRSPIISKIKFFRRENDKRKKDFSPTQLDFGSIKFLIARHFGFCYGVEHAIDIAYKTINENPDKQVYLLSEMIHNPGVNNDLLSKGVKFIMDTSGKQIISWENITNEDIILIPAFGTTVEIEERLKKIGMDIYKYNTTCPFVEKVWNRASSLSESDHTIIIHGKHKHEETRATFSHSKEKGKSIIIRDIKEAETLSKIILGKVKSSQFYNLFYEKYSGGFDPEEDLIKLGVVNQTTMLASETEEIAALLRNTMIQKYGEENIADHYADTRDTLCYATNDNQNATLELLKYEADFAVVVGGYNSSNTSHIVELLEEKFDTYFIASDEEIKSKNEIHHYSLNNKTLVETKNFIPEKEKVNVIITSGASCPDSDVERVVTKLLSFFEGVKSNEEVLSTL